MPNIDIGQLESAAALTTAQLAANKASATQRLVQAVEAHLTALTASYMPSERLAFADKKTAAMTVLDLGVLNSVEQALVTAEVAQTGETEAQWAARVMPNAMAFAAAVGNASGLRSKHATAIAAAADQAALDVVIATMDGDLSALP